MHLLHVQVLLRDNNERLQGRLDELQKRYGQLAMSKTDLSSQLLLTEEEKLKVRFAMHGSISFFATVSLYDFVLCMWLN
jgi:hypothetical protein